MDVVRVGSRMCDSVLWGAETRDEGWLHGIVVGRAQRGDVVDVHDSRSARYGGHRVPASRRNCNRLHVDNNVASRGDRTLPARNHAGSGKSVLGRGSIAPVVRRATVCGANQHGHRLKSVDARVCIRVIASAPFPVGGIAY